jgi:hypothetical protein
MEIRNEAKQKAQELVDKYMNIGLVKMSDYSKIYQPTAKVCAIIAIDDMLNEYKQNSTFAQLEWVDYRIAFLEEVKKEIENL